MDGDPGWLYNWEELVREGYAWVGVSAQQQGVQGGGFSIPIPGPPQMPRTTSDAARYGTLQHPGDDYSYDIFTQVGLVLRRPGSVDMLAGLRVEQLIAYGESQSAFRMVSYV